MLPQSCVRLLSRTVPLIICNLWFICNVPLCVLLISVDTRLNVLVKKYLKIVNTEQSFMFITRWTSREGSLTTYGMDSILVGPGRHPTSVTCTSVSLSLSSSCSVSASSESELCPLSSSFIFTTGKTYFSESLNPEIFLHHFVCVMVYS